MSTRFRASVRIAVIAGVVSLGGADAWAQGPTIDTPDNPSPGGGKSPFGKTPGGGASVSDQPSDSLLGGRAGPTTPKGIPTSISTPGMSTLEPVRQAGRRPDAEHPGGDDPRLGPARAPADRGRPGSARRHDARPGDRPHRSTRTWTSSPSSSRSPRPRPTSSPPASGPTPSSTPTPSSSPTASTPATDRAARPSTTSTSPIRSTSPGSGRPGPPRPSGRPRSPRPSIRTPSARRSTTSTPAYVDVLQARRTIAFSEAGLEGLKSSLEATEDLLKQGKEQEAERRPPRSGSRSDLAEQQLLREQGGLPQGQAGPGDPAQHPARPGRVDRALRDAQRSRVSRPHRSTR